MYEAILQFFSAKKHGLRRTGLLALMSFAPAFLLAQEDNYIGGKVTDEISGRPVAGCSVYFSNTSKGDITTASGEFLLKKLPAGKYQLIISAIGYETEVILVSSNNYPHKLEVGLHIHSSALSEVVVQPSLRNGWQKWGQTFLENFIGTTPNASRCRILNYEVISFWFTEKTNRLTARAEEPLIIKNEALGYTIKFKLEEFTLDFTSRLMVYNGYPLFQEMTGAKEKENKWKENREAAYYGSMLDFMRCLYLGRWLEAGYHIVTYVKKPNAEKLRVQQIMDATNAVKTDSIAPNTPGNNGTAKPHPVKDSAGYFRKILKQPDSLSVYVSLTALDSMLVDGEDDSKVFFFDNKLEILYRRHKQSKDEQQSEIYLRTPEAVHVEENGSYFSPRELVTSGHWGQFEKMANLLPFDYVP